MNNFLPEIQKLNFISENNIPIIIFFYFFFTRSVVFKLFNTPHTMKQQIFGQNTYHLRCILDLYFRIMMRKSILLLKSDSKIPLLCDILTVAVDFSQGTWICSLAEVKCSTWLWQCCFEGNQNYVDHFA